MRVGRDTVKDKNGKIKKFQYKDVKYDSDKWVNCNDFEPNEYDLVLMKLENGKIISGWIGLNNWEGLNLKKNDKVLYWKRKEIL